LHNNSKSPRAELRASHGEKKTVEKQMTEFEKMVRAIISIGLKFEERL
jgi:hypothetical protein